jgi:hypothetical protein
MDATARLHRTAGLLVLFGTLTFNAPELAAQATKAPPKKTPTPVVVPKVNVTASEGTTATAIRGRPANPGAVRTVNAALKTSLTRPAVRAAVLAEIRRQLRTSRPIALVDRHWVSVIDIATVYHLSAVRPELMSAIGPNAAQLIAAAGGAREGLLISFTPAQLGPIVVGDIAKEVSGFAAAALKNAMTGITADNVLFVVTYGLGGLGTGSIVDLVRHIMNEGSGSAPSGNNGDLDGDGIPDSTDADDDGDGYNDDQDHYPRDSSKHICDCGRPAVLFTASAGTELLPGLVSVLGAARAQVSQAVSLGPAAAGQATGVALLIQP